jgi:hypothetical protein
MSFEFGFEFLVLSSGASCSSTCAAGTVAPKLAPEIVVQASRLHS